jgi:sulfur carrier protein
MQLRINDKLHSFEQTTLSIEALMTALDILEWRGVAVAVNKRVVPKSRWREESVEDGDEIEIIRATQGG